MPNPPAEGSGVRPTCLVKRSAKINYRGIYLGGGHLSFPRRRHGATGVWGHASVSRATSGRAKSKEMCGEVRECQAEGNKKSHPCISRGGRRANKGPRQRTEGLRERYRDMPGEGDGKSEPGGRIEVEKNAGIEWKRLEGEGPIIYRDRGRRRKVAAV
jgi:hypothetical protein